MKPISLTKTMPWLLGASAVFTLAFNQNVSAQNSTSQATSIKQVNKTNINQANTNNLNLRMAYLNTSAKLAIGAKTGNWNVPLPANDGLDNYHNQVNAKTFDMPGKYSEDFEVSYLLGDPKPFDDSSLENYSGRYADLTFKDFKTTDEATKSVGYEASSNYQNWPVKDFGDGFKVYKNPDQFTSSKPQYVFYKGPWEIRAGIKYGGYYMDDEQVNNIVFILKEQNWDKLPQIKGHGTISFWDMINSGFAPGPVGEKKYMGLNTKLSWQDGKRRYNLDTSYPQGTTDFPINTVKTAFKMAESLQ